MYILLYDRDIATIYEFEEESKFPEIKRNRKHERYVMKIFECKSELDCFLSTHGQLGVIRHGSKVFKLESTENLLQEIYKEEVKKVFDKYVIKELQ